MMQKRLQLLNMARPRHLPFVNHFGQLFHIFLVWPDRLAPLLRGSELAPCPTSA